jgi:hypothetical protein
MKFVLNAPFDEFIIAMDCKDGCEQLARLAERAAAGEKVGDLLPELEEHMEYWKDCREEFDALVEIIKAEQEGDLPEISRDK